MYVEASTVNPKQPQRGIQAKRGIYFQTAVVSKRVSTKP